MNTIFLHARENIPRSVRLESVYVFWWSFRKLSESYSIWIESLEMFSLKYFVWIAILDETEENWKISSSFKFRSTLFGVRIRVTSWHVLPTNYIISYSIIGINDIHPSKHKCLNQIAHSVQPNLFCRSSRVDPGRGTKMDSIHHQAIQIVAH